MTNPEQALEMIQYWAAKKDSPQKTVVLTYWVKQACKFAKYYYEFNGRRITNTTADKKSAFKALSIAHGVPAKKKGELVHDQMMRLTRI